MITLELYGGKLTVGGGVTPCNVNTWQAECEALEPWPPIGEDGLLRVWFSFFRFGTSKMGNPSSSSLSKTGSFPPCSLVLLRNLKFSRMLDYILPSFLPQLSFRSSDISSLDSSFYGFGSSFFFFQNLVCVPIMFCVSPMSPNKGVKWRNYIFLVVLKTKIGLENWDNIFMR